MSVDIYPIIHSEIIYKFPNEVKLKLRDPYRYKKYIPLKIRSPAPNNIIGCTINIDNGDPISDVRIIVKSDVFKEISTSTDEEGWFKINSKEVGKNIKIELSKIGYKALNYNIQKLNNELLLFELESE